MHKHKCPNRACGLVWEHYGPEHVEYKTEEEYAAAHQCPGCGAETRRKCFRSEEAEPNVAHIVQRKPINGGRPPLPGNPFELLAMLGFLTELEQFFDAKLGESAHQS